MIVFIILIIIGIILFYIASKNELILLRNISSLISLLGLFFLLGKNFSMPYFEVLETVNIIMELLIIL